MSEDERSPTHKRFDDALGEIIFKAVEVEKQRCAAVLTKAKDAAIVENADYPLATSLRDCCDAILASEPELTPPASEPEMTITKMIGRLKAVRNETGFWVDWAGVQNDLHALVQAQVRRGVAIIRDAELAALGRADDDSVASLRECRIALSKSAGRQ